MQTAKTKWPNQTPPLKLAVWLSHITALLLALTMLAAPLTAAKDKADKKDEATKEKAEKAKQKPPAPPALPVTAVRIKPRHIQLWQQFSGNITAVDEVAVRPQVSGLIKAVKFKDGDQVKKGDILFIIDPRPFQAALKQAQAALDTAKTRAEFAKNELRRAQSLVDRRAVAERLLDQRNNEYKTALAEILNAEALVETASINLDFAHIKAPITGKVSRVEITEGNLVEAGANAPVLTTIVANDAVYIDFEVDEQTYLTSVHKATLKDLSKIPVEVILGNGNTAKARILKGFMHSFDNRVNPATGTIRGRALFKNTERGLLPGMSVSIKLGLGNGEQQKQILLSERAVGTDQDRKFVYIINEESKATYREVVLGQSKNGHRVILSGLSEGDIVITEGLIRIRPGALVSPRFLEREGKAHNAAHQIN